MFISLFAVTLAALVAANVTARVALDRASLRLPTAPIGV